MSRGKQESATTTQAVASYAIPIGVFPDPGLLRDIDELRKKHSKTKIKAKRLAERRRYHHR
jgi:hypothetical protein